MPRPRPKQAISLREAISFLIFGVCILVFGCKGSEKVWSAEALSPDGKILARASTVAQSGFGTGYIDTVVSLGWAQDSRHVMPILELSDAFEMPVEEVSVELSWISPTHLELAYKGHRTVTFQAVKWNGIDISVKDLQAAGNS